MLLQACLLPLQPLHLFSVTTSAPLVFWLRLRLPPTCHLVLQFRKLHSGPSTKFRSILQSTDPTQLEVDTRLFPWEHRCLRLKPPTPLAICCSQTVFLEQVFVRTEWYFDLLERGDRANAMLNRSANHQILKVGPPEPIPGGWPCKPFLTQPKEFSTKRGHILKIGSHNWKIDVLDS